MDGLPPEKSPIPADVFTAKESPPAALNSIDVLLVAQSPRTQERGTTQRNGAETPPVGKFEDLPANKQKVVQDEYDKKHKGEIPIGDATMDKSETIRIRLRRMGGMHADGFVSYKKGSEHYDGVLKHIGEMKPGDLKLVAPWPEEKPRNPTPQIKRGGG